MERVILYGTGHHAELVSYYMEYYGLYKVEAFTVQKKYLEKKELLDLPVISYENLPALYPPSNYKMFIAVGPQYVNRVREKIYLNAKAEGYSFANCICPTNSTVPDLIVGENVFIGPTSGVSPFVKIGNNVTIIDSSVGHHCQISDNAFISASVLAGNVTVKNNVVIGLSSTIAPNLCIGERSVIGMGSNITRDVSPGSVYSIKKTTQKRNTDTSKLKLI